MKLRMPTPFYIDQEILGHFLWDYRVAYPRKEHFVECLLYRPNNWAYHIGKLSDDKELIFFFIYDVFFSTFEVECLDLINVYLTQLYPNSWAFEILVDFFWVLFWPLGFYFLYSR